MYSMNGLPYDPSPAFDGFFCTDCNHYIECQYHPFESTPYDKCGQRRDAGHSIVQVGKRHCRACNATAGRLETETVNS